MLTISENERFKKIFEERDRQFQILEYTFYKGGLEEQEPGEDEAEVAAEVPGEDLPPEGEMPGEEIPGGEELPGEVPADVGDETEAIEDMETEPLETPEGDMGIGGDDEIEVDVSDIVQSTKDTEQSVTQATNKLEDLMNTIGSLEQKLNTMDSIIAKIDDLENEIERRNPTQVEKLEMRSLDSYPYNLTLSQFWDEKEKEGRYVAKEEPMETEYEVNDENVMDDYDETMVRDSFKKSFYDEKNDF